MLRGSGRAAGEPATTRSLVISDEPYKHRWSSTAASRPRRRRSSRRTVICQFLVEVAWRLRASASAIWRSRRGCEEADALRDACTFTNRILGFINAPAIWQWVVAEARGRDRRRGGLPAQARPAVRRARRFGYEVHQPAGDLLRLPEDADPRRHGVRAPAAGRGHPGRARDRLRPRAATSASRSPSRADTIERSLPGFERAWRAVQ